MMANCMYCHQQIVEDTHGWGYFILDDEGLEKFHSECAEVIGGIKLEESLHG